MICREARVKSTTAFKIELCTILRPTTLRCWHKPIIISDRESPMCHCDQFGVSWCASAASPLSQWCQQIPVEPDE